jgi:large subunit ribosomal protein L21
LAIGSYNAIPTSWKKKFFAKGSKMYAIVRTGGKQYRVAQGDTLRVEKLPAEKGGSVELSDVLLIGGDGGVRVGQPTISGAKVTAEVMEQGRGKKLIVYKFKRRKNYRRKNGHRQAFTLLKITEIKG